MSERPTTVDAIGAARRLQSLACAGYGVAPLADLMAAHRMHVKAWQRHRWQSIHLATHERIAYTYLRLWDTDGGSTLARDHAARRGWHPFEAWTDVTIDDPGAYPYGDPAQINYIDRVLIKRVRDGKRPYLDLSDAERIELLTQHLTAGGTMRGFRDRYRPVPKRQLDLLIAQRPDIWPLVQPLHLPTRIIEGRVSIESLRLVS
jgi:hypothetical protein